MEEDQEMAKMRKELENAEKKFRKLLEKRDEINKEADFIKNERDTLNAEKRKLVDKMNELKTKRDEIVKVMKMHKASRENFQKRARELIKAKSTRREDLYKELPNEIGLLDAEIRMLEMKHQTTPMSLQKENDILDKIRIMREELDDLMAKDREQEIVRVEIGKIDEFIDELFKRADEKHALVVQLSQEAQGWHEKMQEYIKEINLLRQVADKKHEEQGKLRDRANYYHERAMKMREKLIELRKLRREQLSEARRVIDEQNIKVREMFEDEERLQEAANKALDELLKKGKFKM